MTEHMTDEQGAKLIDHLKRTLAPIQYGDPKELGIDLRENGTWVLIPVRDMKQVVRTTVQLPTNYRTLVEPVITLREAAEHALAAYDDRVARSQAPIGKIHSMEMLRAALDLRREHDTIREAANAMLVAWDKWYRGNATQRGSAGALSYVEGAADGLRVVLEST